MEGGKLLPTSVREKTARAVRIGLHNLSTISGDRKRYRRVLSRNNLYLDHIRRTASVASSVPADRFCAIIRQLRKVNCDPSRLLTDIGTDTILTLSHSEC
jgi:hypothetical protein